MCLSACNYDEIILVWVLENRTEIASTMLIVSYPTLAFVRKEADDEAFAVTFVATGFCHWSIGR